MLVAFVLLAALGWIALWGIMDIMMQSINRKDRFLVYMGILIFVSGVVSTCPELLQHM
jgi:hypothetical protein